MFPNIAGMLVLGIQKVLISSIPTHSVRFQVLYAGGDVKVNVAFNYPLVRIIAEIEMGIKTQNREKEVMAGFIHSPVPDYLPKGSREALNNALFYRDYIKMDSSYFQ